MAIPTEPIGSIPRPRELIEGMEAFAAGRIPGRELDALYEEAVRDTIERFDATGSPVITDGEQRKPSFVTIPSRVPRRSRLTASRFLSRTDTNGGCRD